MPYTLDQYEYALVFRPYEDDEGRMHMQLGMVYSDNDAPGEWRYITVMTMLLLSSAFSMMQEDDDVYEMFKKRLMEIAAKSKQDDDEEGISEILDELDESVVYEYLDEDKKIIKLHMNTKTEGNA